MRTAVGMGRPHDSDSRPHHPQPGAQGRPTRVGGDRATPPSTLAEPIIVAGYYSAAVSP